jgi:hypothetical protein
LSNHLLSLLTVDHETQVDQSDDTIQCEITITDHSTTSGQNRTLTLNIVTTINDLYDEDADDLTESDDPNIDTDPADVTPTVAELQFTAANRTLVANGSPLIQVSRPEEQTHSQLTTVEQMKALFDNPTYLRDSNPFTITDTAFTIQQNGNLDLTTAQDFETMSANPIVLTITAHDQNGGSKTFKLQLTITDAEAGFSNDNRLSISPTSTDEAEFTPATDWSGFDAKQTSNDQLDNAVLSNPQNAITVVQNLENLFSAPKELAGNPYTITGADSNDFELSSNNSNADLKLKQNTTITTTTGTGVVNKTFTLIAARRGSGKNNMRIDFEIPMTKLTLATGNNLNLTSVDIAENTSNQQVVLFSTIASRLLNSTLLDTSTPYTVNDATNFTVDATGVKLSVAQNYEDNSKVTTVNIVAHDKNDNTLTFVQPVNITNVLDEDLDGINEDTTNRDDPTQVGDGLDDTPDTAHMQFKSTDWTSGVTTATVLPDEGIEATETGGIVKKLTFTTNEIDENNNETVIAVLDDNIFDNPEKLHATRPFYHNTASPTTSYTDTNFKIEKDASDSKWKLYLLANRDHESIPAIDQSKLTTTFYVMYDGENTHKSTNLVIDVVCEIDDVTDTSITWVYQGTGILGNTDSVDFAENTLTTTVVTQVKATGDDATGTAIAYSIDTGKDASLFTINSSNGEIKFVNSPDFEDPQQDGTTDNQYVIDVRASYSNITDSTLDATRTITITVTDVAYDEPVQWSHTTLAYNAPENSTSTIATLDAPTSDDAEEVELAITGGADQDKFNLSSTRELTFASEKNYEDPDDADTDRQYTVEITARYSKAAGHSASPVTKTFTITLTDVAYDESITWQDTDGTNYADETVTYAENVASPYTVKTFDAPTSDDAAPVELAITGGADQNKFQMTGNTLQFKSSPDHENPQQAGDTENQYEVDVTARYSDSAGQSSGSPITVTITVNVTDAADENPTITGGDGSYTVESGTSNSSLFTLAGTSDTGSAVRWTSNNNKFTITSGDVSSGNNATVAYTGTSITSNSVTVTFTCTDTSGTSLTATKNVTITVTQPADPGGE